MEAIEQLKAMRNQAKARIEAHPDYKLMAKLTVLIEELEQEFSGSGSEGTDEGDGTAEDDSEEDLTGEDLTGLPDDTSFAPEAVTLEAASEADAADEEPAETEPSDALEEMAIPELEIDIQEEDEFYSDPAVVAEADLETEHAPAPAVTLDSQANSVLEALGKLTGATPDEEVPDGQAVHDIELTPEIDPLDEIMDDVGMALERELTMEGGAQSFEDTDPDADLDYVDIDKAREARRRN